MDKRLLMGNEAIALGAIRAGVKVATGYPGTPSTEILETIAKEKPEGVYAEWSVNEKSAMEVAAGAAIAGARTLVTMKQVGLNVASDPLMSLNYVGVKAGMVIVVADDPGPISSQTEQDTRHFGKFAKIPVFDPATPEEAYTMIADAFYYSEKIGRPVILRPTTRICHGYASVELLPKLPGLEPVGFEKDGGRWVIFPKLSYQNHIKIEATLRDLSEEFSSYRGNSLTGLGEQVADASKIRRGIAAGGVSTSYAKEALSILNADPAEYRFLKIGTVPFPEPLGLAFLQGLDEVLVTEELDPVIEDALVQLCGLHRLNVKIRGKRTGDMPNAGENTVAIIEAALQKFLELPQAVSNIVGLNAANSDLPVLPIRPPVLCAGCPHRGSFYAVKEAMKGKNAVFSGDIGCYTLGNALPLDMVNTCLCMGAGITQAQGLGRAEPDATHFAFIGDSTFFHTGIPGLINAVYNDADVIFVVLDNSTTAMTGGQPHPGTGRTLMGAPEKKMSIHDLIKAAGVDFVERVNAFDLKAAKAAVSRAADEKGVRVLLFEGACVNIVPKGKPYSVNKENCIGCKICTLKLGCPALSSDAKGKAEVDQIQCTGCGLCEKVCPFGAFGVE